MVWSAWVSQTVLREIVMRRGDAMTAALARAWLPTACPDGAWISLYTCELRPTCVPGPRLRRQHGSRRLVPTEPGLRLSRWLLT